MNNLDRLFNDKLANHTLIPSDAAWEKITAKLSKKNSYTQWQRWAAVIIPGIVFSGLIWWNNTASPSSVLSNETTQPVAPPVTNEPARVAMNPSPTATHFEPKKIYRTPEARREPVSEAEEMHEEPSILPEVLTLSAPAIAPSPEATAPAMQVAKAIVLVYTLPSIDPTSVSEDIKPSSLERVVEFAKTVKHSDPLGDLRVMKEELLALGLRNKLSKKN